MTQAPIKINSNVQFTQNFDGETFFKLSDTKRLVLQIELFK